MAEAQALFLDFDGTLVEIADTPDAVRVDPALPALLLRLRDRLGGALAIVSGRPIDGLDGFLAPARFDAVGLHGLERRVGGVSFPCRPDDYPSLRAAIDRLRMTAPPALLIEDKGCSVAVHWRTAPERAADAAALVAHAMQALGSHYRLQKGKAVLEILPAHAGKGAAIRSLLLAGPYLGRQPVFIGDDRTDEQGFAAVNEAGGVSIKVGPGETSARLCIASPSALRQRLVAWADGAEIGPDFDTTR